MNFIIINSSLLKYCHSLYIKEKHSTPLKQLKTLTIGVFLTIGVILTIEDIFNELTCNKSLKKRLKRFYSTQ